MFYPVSEAGCSSDLAALVIVSAIITASVYLKNGDAIEVNQVDLTPTQMVEMSDKLQAANSFFNVKDFKQAEFFYEEILTKYDCKEADARGRMKILNVEKYNKIIASCD